MTGDRVLGVVVGAVALALLVVGVASVAAHPTRTVLEDYVDEAGVMLFALGVTLALLAFRLLRGSRPR